MINLIKRVFTLPFSLIILIGVILRLILLFVYEVPTYTPDTNSYIELASFLIKGDMSQYQGWRTPGYSILLFPSLGKYYGITILMQFVFNVATTFFIYDIIKKHSAKLAFVSGLLFFTMSRTMFYEFALLTETAILFCVTLAIWLIYNYRILNIEANFKIILLFSFVLLGAFFVRPMFIYLTPIVVFFMLWHIKQKEWKKHLCKILIVLIVPFTGYFGWNLFNYNNHNWFTVTTFTGITMSQTTYSFFHKASDEHKVLRDIYVKHINESDDIINGKIDENANYNVAAFKRMSENGDVEGIISLSIWRSIYEMEEVTGLSQLELSQELLLISKELIAENPDAYFNQVCESWVTFWQNKDIPINNAYAINQSVINVFRWLMDIQKYLFIFINMMLIISAVVVAIRNIRNRNIFDNELFLLTIILAASMAQAMVTYGGGSRFAFPLVGAILISVCSIFDKGKVNI